MMGPTVNEFVLPMLVGMTEWCLLNRVSERSAV